VLREKLLGPEWVVRWVRELKLEALRERGSSLLDEAKVVDEFLSAVRKTVGGWAMILTGPLGGPIDKATLRAAFTTTYLGHGAVNPGHRIDHDDQRQWRTQESKGRNAVVSLHLQLSEVEAGA
jgi:hypothetical protein